MSDTLGAMRARVVLQSPTRVADEIGGAAIAWTDEGEAWARIEALSGAQIAAYDGAPAYGALRVSINRRAVAAGWRIVWGARRLRITGVSDGGGARIDLACEEEIL